MLFYRITSSQGNYQHHACTHHPDHLGSASLITDPEGEIYERIEYTPGEEMWVELQEDDASSYLNMIPFRYTGKELDRETGFYCYGTRYYEPRISRWLSADPAGFELVNPSFKDYFEFILNHSGPSGQVLIHVFNAANGDVGTQQMLSEATKAASVMLMRDSAEFSTSAGDAASLVAVTAAVSGVEHVAAGAVIVDTTADVVSLAMNGAADLIKGESLSKVASFIGGLFASGDKDE